MIDNFEFTRLAIKWPARIMGSHWGLISQVPVFELRQAVALSVGLNPLFVTSNSARVDVWMILGKKLKDVHLEELPLFDPEWKTKNTIKLGEKGNALICFLERLTVALSNVEPYGSLHTVEKNENDLEHCAVRLTDFASWAEKKEWDLPNGFPGRSLGNLVGTPAKNGSDLPKKGVNVNLPHITKVLDVLFKVMNAIWTDFDPSNLPKQRSVAQEIDEMLAWNAQSDGEPSRRAQTLAAVIRPDEFADSDMRIKAHRSTKQRKRG